VVLAMIALISSEVISRLLAARIRG
jgi:hypothetical protein